jgi:hypothetical protein
MYVNQPIITDANGVRRFKKNAIVRWLLDTSHMGGIDMNLIAITPFSDEDRKQFYQLIGYTVCGYFEIFEDEDEDTIA